MRLFRAAFALTRMRIQERMRGCFFVEPHVMTGHANVIRVCQAQTVPFLGEQMARMAWHGMDPYLTTRPPRPPLEVGRSHPLLGRCAAAGREKRAVPTMHPPKPLSETDLQFASSSRVLSRESTVVPRFCQPGASDAPRRPADPRLFSWPWALRYARYTSESGDLDGGEKIEGHMTAPFWW